tara:strand:+ start:116 stop:289 length:174 start_codon:yes stop_codon:yes gene_type:complete
MKKIITLALLTVGCATSQPEKLDWDNLLHKEGLKNVAYKSIVKKDYEAEDYNDRKGL